MSKQPQSQPVTDLTTLEDESNPAQHDLDQNGVDPDFADFTEQPAAAFSTQAKTEPPATEPSIKASNKKSTNVVAWFALLLALIGLGALGGGYYLWTQQQGIQQQQIAQWQVEQNQHLSGLEQQLKQQIGEQLSSSQAQILAQQQLAQSALSDEVSGRVNAIDARLSEFSGRQPNDWGLAEAQYLIRIAGRKLWLEHDTKTAQSLLATADVQINALNDPSLMPLRQMISQDIATLRALPEPRITDAHMALSGLISTIDSLLVNTIEPFNGKLNEQNVVTTPDPNATWQQNLSNAVHEFVTNVFYFNTGAAEGDIEPLKMPHQQWYLRANLKMAMLQAQVAVLQRDQTVFNDTIRRAITWLDLFKSTDSAVQAAKLTLTSLLESPIVVTYPDTFVSQKMIDQLLRQRLGSAYQQLAPVVKPVVEPVEAPLPESVSEPLTESAPPASGGEL